MGGNTLVFLFPTLMSEKLICMTHQALILHLCTHYSPSPLFTHTWFWYVKFFLTINRLKYCCQSDVGTLVSHKFKECILGLTFSNRISLVGCKKNISWIPAKGSHRIKKCHKKWKKYTIFLTAPPLWFWEKIEIWKPST